MDSPLARKPCKQQKRSDKHLTVTPIRTGLTCEQDESDVLKGVLGQSPARVRDYASKLQCFNVLHSSLQNTSRTSLFVDNDQLKLVHGFVVLHLGNALSEKSKDDSQGTTNDTTNELLETIVLCLRDIYQHTITQSIFSKEELQIVFRLVVQRASNLSFVPEHQNDHPSNTLQPDDEDNRDLSLSVASTLLDISRRLLSQLTPKSETVESLHIFLARLIFRGCEGPNNAIYHNAQSLLRELAHSQNSQIAKRASWAMAAIATIQQETNVNLKNQSASTTDCLMFWRCLAQSTEGATKLSHAASVLDQLVDMAVRNYDKANAICSVECLSQIAIHRSDRVQEATSNVNCVSDRVQSSILQVLIYADDPDVQKRTIPGLQHCEAQLLRWEDSQLIRNTLTTLLTIATDKSRRSQANDQKYRIGAATILIGIIENVLLQHQQRSLSLPVSYSEATSFITFLLYDESASILHLAADAVHREVQRDESRIALQSHETLSQLAAASYSLHPSAKLRRKTIDILEVVTRSEETLGILARQKKILEVLVTVASSSVEGNDSGASRTLKNLALTVLIRLSKNACNRRILAKQVGVIACMIRYARNVSDQQTGEEQREVEPTVCLVDLKQKIMDLAIAL